MRQTNQKTLVLTFLLWTFFVTISSAQPRFHRRPRMRPYQPTAAIGLRLGNDFQHDDYVLGGQLKLPVGRFWQFVPSFDYYFTDAKTKADLWRFNGNLVFKPLPRAPLYFGGGVTIDYLTIDEGDSFTNTGGNALIGLEFGSARKTPMRPYIQAQWTFQEETFFTLFGGINLILK